MVTPYQKASQVWDERIGSSRLQAHNWRLMAFGCLGLSIALLGGLVWLLRSGSAVPYVVDAPPGLLTSLDLPITAPRHALT